MFPLDVGGFARLHLPAATTGRISCPARQLAAPAAGGVHCGKRWDAMANAAPAVAARSVLTGYTRLCAALGAGGAGGSPMAWENSVIPLLVLCQLRL